jgi:hypothetical protein
MAIYELFSERERKRLGGKEPDVFQYDTLPEMLRNQIVLLWRDALGSYIPLRAAARHSKSNMAWIDIEKLLCQELGIFRLAADLHHPDARVEEYFLKVQAIADALSVVEVVFQRINRRVEAEFLVDKGANSDLNARLRKHGVGYQYESGRIIRMDTIYSHDEMVKPALLLLSQPGFEGANDEFLKAHEYYRKGVKSPAINEALKAFESTMKCICAQRRIPFDSKWQTKDLIKCMIDRGVLTTKLESH